jgi:hypothetical protein
MRRQGAHFARAPNLARLKTFSKERFSSTRPTINRAMRPIPDDFAINAALHATARSSLKIKL